MRRVLLLAAVLSLLGAEPLAAEEGWQEKIDVWTRDWKSAPGTKIYLSQPVDASEDGAYYPFLDRVRGAISGALANRGLRVQTGLTDAECYVVVRFNASTAGLNLDATVRTVADGSLVEGRSLRLDSRDLPRDWDQRTLKDVARELCSKLMESLVGQRLTVEFGEFSGGEREEDGLVSEISLTLKEYMLEELSRAEALSLVTGSKRSGAQSLHKLEGRFSLVGKKVLFRLNLLAPDGQRLETKVTARLPHSQLPAGLSLFPKNRQTAAKGVEVEPAKAAAEAGVPVRVWVNKESGVYRDGDPLVISVLPGAACYARVYYIQSDGTVFQVFPNAPGDAGKLAAGVTRSIGGSESRVELTINDETLGQEFVKVFASPGPIDDSALPRNYYDSLGVFEVRGGYAGLRKAIRGGGDGQKTLRPAAEAKILIAGKR